MYKEIRVRINDVDRVEKIVLCFVYLYIFDFLLCTIYEEVYNCLCVVLIFYYIFLIFHT